MRTGLPLLRKELSITLLRKVGDELPRILAKLDAKIEEVMCCALHEAGVRGQC